MSPVTVLQTKQGSEREKETTGGFEGSCDMLVKSSARYLAAFWVLLTWLAKEEKCNKEGITSLGKRQEYTLQIVRILGKPFPIVNTQVNGLHGLQARSF